MEGEPPQRSPLPTPEPPRQINQEVAEFVGLQDTNDDEGNAAVDPSLIKIWTKLINKGLDKEKKAAVLKDFPKAPEFEPKKLNPEIAASLAPKNIKKDSYMAELQKLAGSQLMVVGTALTIMMYDQEFDRMAIVNLFNEVAKLAIEIHHAVSLSRRANIFIPNLSPQVAELIKKAN